MDDREGQVVRRARAGDRQACATLFAANWRTVYAWMLGFTRDRGEAEDLTQQTFLRAWTRMGQLRDPARFLPWLRTIARTVAFGRRRPKPVALRPEPVGDDPSVSVEHREARDLVGRALDRLSPDDRSLLLLVFVEDIPLARVAALLETPVTTLRRRVADALKRFRTVVEKEGKIHELR
jgi:RNA polymerase sigma-70 factor (ECF subfamily)